MSKSPETILFVGRFQPFHLGHLTLVKWLYQNYDNLIIGIGSSNECYTLENPFTAGERFRMIKNTLKVEKITNVDIIPISDIKDNSAWVSHIKNVCPPFDIVAIGRRYHPMFNINGVKTVTTPKFEREKFKGTIIRTMMASFLVPNEWLIFVPEPVANVLQQINGVDRVRNIMEVEENDDA